MPKTIKDEYYSSHEKMGYQGRVAKRATNEEETNRGNFLEKGKNEEGVQDTPQHTEPEWWDNY